MGSRARDGILVGTGAGAALVVLLVLQSSIPGTGLLTGSSLRTETSTLTATATTTVTYPPPLMPAVSEWFNDFQHRDVTDLGNLYAQNATVVWTGQTNGLAGTYKGAGNIRILYGSTLGKDTSISASMGNYSEKAISASDTRATFSLEMNESNPYAGPTSSPATVISDVVVTQEWKYNATGAAAQWEIEEESWNFTYYSFKCVFADCGPPQSGTSTAALRSSTTSVSMTVSFPLPCPEVNNTVLDPAPKGTVYMKVVTDEGTVITLGISSDVAGAMITGSLAPS